FRPGVRFGTESRVLYIMDFLIPLYQDEKNIVFSNIKYTPNDHEGWEVNLGAGYRRLLWDEKLILGLNAYYDQRRTDWGTNHEQWGLGLEAMADIPLESFNLGLTGRFNYYYPLSHTKIDGLGTPYAKYALSDSGIVLTGGRVEEPIRGFDYEAGVRIPYISKYVETWAYVGGYNYQGRRVRDINGFMTRLEIIPTDFMRLNYEFHHDNYSKAEHYGEVTFEVPFSMGNLVTGKNPFEGIGDVFTGSRELKARMVEPVRRDVDVKVIVDDDNDNIPGGGGEIEDIVFVSETGSDVTGDGTMENPYATLSFALASDPRIIAGTCRTIHVMNSSTIATVDESVAGVLSLDIADFLLWGSGVNHPKYPVSNMPYSGHPTVFGDTLHLNAANPTVTGLGFDANGINYCIEIINGSGGTGIKITNNTFTLTNALSAYGIRADIGADIGSEGNPIIIANNTFDIESTGENAYGIGLATPGNIFAKITKNDMSNTIEGDSNGAGIYLDASGAIGSATTPLIVSGNPINVRGNTGDAWGIRINAGSDIFAYVTGNDMSNSIWADTEAYGIYIYSSSGGLGSEARPIIVAGNPMKVYSDIFGACGAYLFANSDIFADVVENDMSNTIEASEWAYGVLIRSINGNIGSETKPVVVSKNPMTVTSNITDAYGISIEASAVAPNGDIFAVVTENDMTGMVRGNDNAYGINFLSPNGNVGSETSPVIVSGNPMFVTGYNSNGYGINIWAGNNLFAAITGNYMGETASGGSSIHGELEAYGIRLRAVNGSMGSAACPVIVSGNPVSVNATGSGLPNVSAYGIRLEEAAGTGIFAAVIGNDLSHNISAEDYAYGISIYNLTSGMGSEACPVIISGNPITATSDPGEAYGIHLHSTTGSFAAITGNDLSNTITGGSNATGIYLLSTAGSLGSETRPVIIAGNPMTVNCPYAGSISYGMYLNANGAGSNIFANVVGNDMSGGVSGVNSAYGIYMSADGIGSESNPVIVSENPMTVTAALTAVGSIAHGIYFSSVNNIFSSIIGNDMSNTITANAEAYGIRLNSAAGNIGTDLRPVIISGNSITATVDTGVLTSDAYGIWLQAPAAAAGNIFASITGNDMSNTITGADHIYGMYILGNSIGSATSPLFISENLIAATSTGNDAYGIYIQSINDVFGSITGNNMLNNIRGSGGTYGIQLFSTSGSLGSAASPLLISGNAMSVTSSANLAYGTYLYGALDVFANIKHNYMDIVSTTSAAFGGYIIGFNLIGNVASTPTIFYDNSGIVNGAVDRYMLYLDTGTVGGGNYVLWGENGFRPAGGDGTWSGNYDVGETLPQPLVDQDQPVRTDFGAGDVITP
ncbi:MAG: inverse autotransporter beta domain-containing protein, partial [Deltaproteobacteria bacterium]|nr:inverse autotransporter beta domain-containing protein [Candidatus Zymogenus saltonus]